MCFDEVFTPRHVKSVYRNFKSVSNLSSLVLHLNTEDLIEIFLA